MHTCGNPVDVILPFSTIIVSTEGKVTMLVDGIEGDKLGDGEQLGGLRRDDFRALDRGEGVQLGGMEGSSTTFRDGHKDTRFRR